jgi:hypothetical protein
MREIIEILKDLIVKSSALSPCPDGHKDYVINGDIMQEIYDYVRESEETKSYTNKDIIDVVKLQNEVIGIQNETLRLIFEKIIDKTTST